jgi:hypothetical protein
MIFKPKKKSKINLERLHYFYAVCHRCNSITQHSIYGSFCLICNKHRMAPQINGKTDSLRLMNKERIEMKLIKNLYCWLVWLFHVHKWVDEAVVDVVASSADPGEKPLRGRMYIQKCACMDRRKQSFIVDER